MGPHPVQPNPQNVQNIHIKPVTKGGTNVQIKQEGGQFDCVGTYKSIFSLDRNKF